MRYQLRFPIEAIQFKGDNVAELEYFFRNDKKRFRKARSGYEVKVASGSWLAIAKTEWLRRDLNGNIVLMDAEQFAKEYKGVE